FFASNVGLIISRLTPSADCPLMVSRIRRTLEASTSSVGASFFLDENVFWQLGHIRRDPPRLIFADNLAAELKKAACRRCAVAQRVVPTHQIEFAKYGRV